MQRAWELVRYAIDNAARARLRSALTATGIAIASGALVCMVAFILGLREQVEAPIEKLGLLNNIEVSPAQPTKTDSAEGDNEQTPEPVLDDAMLDRLEKIPGVDYAYPDFRLSEITISRGEHSQSAYAVGLPREVSLVSLFGDFLIAGEYFSLDSEVEIILGEKTLDGLGLSNPQEAVGQVIQLEAAGLAPAEGQQFEFQRRQLNVRVSGVFRPPGFATHLGGNAVLLPVDAMRDLPGTRFERSLERLRSNEAAMPEGFSQVIVRAKHARDVPRIENEIKRIGFRTRALVTRMEEARTFFLFMELLLGSVGTVALVVAGLGIVNTLLMTVMERYQEIGIYKAIGASRGDIRILFLTEAALVGFVGALGGLMLAWLVSWIVQWVFNDFAARQGVDGPIAAFRFPWWLLVGSVVYTLLVSLLSGLYPAARAAGVDPIQALRHE